MSTNIVQNKFLNIKTEARNATEKNIKKIR